MLILHARSGPRSASYCCKPVLTNPPNLPPAPHTQPTYILNHTPTRPRTPPTQPNYLLNHTHQPSQPTSYTKLQALVHDILPSRRKVPESDAWSVLLHHTPTHPAYLLHHTPPQPAYLLHHTPPQPAYLLHHTPTQPACLLHHTPTQPTYLLRRLPHRPRWCCFLTTALPLCRRLSVGPTRNTVTRSLRPLASGPRCPLRAVWWRSVGAWPVDMSRGSTVTVTSGRRLY